MLFDCLFVPGGIPAVCRLVFLLLLFVSGVVPAGAAVLVPPDDDRVAYTGRIDRTDPVRPVIYWPGSRIGVRFEGSRRASVILEDEKGLNRFYLVVNGDEKKVWKFRSHRGRREYRLPFSLNPGFHTLELFKATEYFHGRTVFHGFQLDDEARSFELPVRNRRILFFGDSITAGMGGLDPTGIRFAMPRYTDHYLSYAAIAARHLDADHIAVCRSGIGFMASWFSVNMPELFLRVRPDDPDSRVDPEYERPDLIVVNLGQNDSLLVFRKGGFLESFQGDKDAYISGRYAAFLRTLLDTYPGVPVLCVLGGMSVVREGSPWPGYIRRAVESVREERPGVLLEPFFLPLMGDLVHPVAAQHAEMAELLAEKIRSLLSW